MIRVLTDSEAHPNGVVGKDSPDSAGVGIDHIRCASLALDRGMAGSIHAPASAFCKHPPRQLPDAEAFVELERYISG